MTLQDVIDETRKELYKGFQIKAFKQTAAMERHAHKEIAAAIDRALTNMKATPQERQEILNPAWLDMIIQPFIYKAFAKIRDYSAKT